MRWGTLAPYGTMVAPEPTREPTREPLAPPVRLGAVMSATAATTASAPDLGAVSWHPAHQLWDGARVTPQGYREVSALELAAVLGRVRVVHIELPAVAARCERGSTTVATVATASRLEPSALWAEIGGWCASATTVVVTEDEESSRWWSARLAAAGLRRVLRLSGGVAAWRAAELPTQP